MAILLCASPYILSVIVSLALGLYWHRRGELIGDEPK